MLSKGTLTETWTPTQSVLRLVPGSTSARGGAAQRPR